MTPLSRVWPGRALGPALTLKELNVVCWALFLAFLVLPLSLTLKGHFESGEPLHLVDADFVYFYSMGRILNEHPAEELYNYDLQRQICTEVHRLKSGEYGPIPYPPFIGILFRPFAWMPYPVAYLLWLSVSLTLYLAGLAILSARLFPHDPLLKSLLLCFALSFSPFVIETLASGHISTIGFFALALAFRAQDGDRPLTAGLALSICLYKPTLLVLLLPLHLVTGSFRLLAGFGIGAASLALFSVMVEGLRVWTGYVHMLSSFAVGAAPIHASSFKRLWKYVDFSSLSSSMPGIGTRLGLAMLACWVAFSLFRLWRKSARAGDAGRRIAWAAALTWTLLLNLYVPIYDSILAVLSAAITIAVLKDVQDRFLRLSFTLVCLLIFASSWVTQDTAAATGFQIITALLAALGMVQFAAFSRVARPGN